MLVLTVRQPWAYLIFNAGKNIENRDWPTRVRGRVAIHTSRDLKWTEWSDAEDTLRSVQSQPGGSPLACLPQVKINTGKRGAVKFTEIPPEIVLGSIIGTVEIVDCVSSVGHSSDWLVGPWGFVLKNPILLPTPIPAKGKLGFWEYPL